MSTKLDTFKDIPDEMLWKGNALDQIEEFKKLAKSLGLHWATVGYHTSKSIPLPVVRFSTRNAQVYVRDNFYDINVCVVSKKPITTPLSVLFDGIITPPEPWDWYLNEISRCRGYSWREWTDEQMDDPNLLSLSPDAPWYMVRKLEEKAAWIKRMTDPTWYGMQWSGGVISWEGDFGPDAKLYVQHHAYLEGILELVPKTAVEPYKPGCMGFAIALENLTEAEALIQRLGSDASQICMEL